MIRVALQHDGKACDIGLIRDLIFGLMFPDRSRRCFMIEIDRGTTPVTRSDLSQSSFERKMRAYRCAYPANEHIRRFGWKAFRVLVVTTDQHRMQSMMDALRRINVPHGPGGALLFFATRQQLWGDPLAHLWRDGNGVVARLI
jgi:hypothetical protein